MSNSVAGRTVFPLLLAALCLASSPSAFAASVQVYNSLSDFRSFLSSFAPGETGKNLAAWDQFEAKYSAVYSSAVFDHSLPDWQTKRRQRLEIFFGKLPSIQDAILAFMESAEQTVHLQAARFAEKFPDLGEGIPVYILPSVLSFNGKVGVLPDRKDFALVLGADVIVLRSDDLDTLFSHEFFHAYQFEKLGEKATDHTFASPLWYEGLAVEASRLLNPGKSESSLLMDGELASNCASADFVREQAALYLPIFSIPYANPDVTEDARALYKDWFTLSGKTDPKRRAYCLGFRVAERLAREHPIAEMMSWDETQFSSQSETVLKALAQ